MMKRFQIVSSILFVFILISVAGGNQAVIPSNVVLNGLDTSAALRIEGFIKERMEELHSPGLGVGIVKGDKLIYSGYFGWSDIEARKPVDDKSMFRIGSISKTMTAIGLMQQWELGKCKLDDDVNKYLPKPYIRPPHPETKPVTLRHLLTHTSGGGEFLSYRQFTQPMLGLTVRGDTYLSLDHYLKIGMKTKIDPGRKWAYCNYGFGYVGLALETIAGEPFHIYQKKNLFDRLGMRMSNFRHTDEILDHLVTGYLHKGNGYKVDPHKAVGITPAGNVYTNVSEMALYVIALLNGGKNSHGTVIKPETLDMMMKTHFSRNKRMGGLGLCFNIYGSDIWGHRVLGHAGAVPFGNTSIMLLVLKERVGVFVFSNSYSYSPKQIGWGILKQVLGVKDTPLPVMEPGRGVRRELIGYYGPELGGFKTNTRLYMNSIGKFRVMESEGNLVLVHTWKGKGKAKILRQVNGDDPNFFQLEDDKSPIPVYVAFRKTEEGRIYIITNGLNQYIKYGPLRTIRSKITAIPGRGISNLIP